jgi:hypothetical protein
MIRIERRIGCSVGGSVGERLLVRLWRRIEYNRLGLGRRLWYKLGGRIWGSIGTSLDRLYFKVWRRVKDTSE